MDAVNPTAVGTALAVAAVPIYHLLIKKPAAKDAGDKPPLRRRSSVPGCGAASYAIDATLPLTRHRPQACLLRKTDVWKAYGVASIVYFLATIDATFISKYELDVTEVGTEVDLVLSFVAVVATEAWTVLF